MFMFDESDQHAAEPLRRARHRSAPARGGRARDAAAGRPGRAVARRIRARHPRRGRARSCPNRRHRQPERLSERDARRALSHHPAARTADLSWAGGVATILIGAHHGLIGSQMMAPVDASYLADAVILMRYFETTARCGRRSRSSRSAAARTNARSASSGLRVTASRVGPPLRNFRGILTGVPVHRRWRQEWRGVNLRRPTLRCPVSGASWFLRPLIADADLAQSVLTRAGIASEYLP